MSMLKRIWSRQSEPPVPPDSAPAPNTAPEGAAPENNTVDDRPKEDDEEGAEAEPLADSPPEPEGVTMKRPSKRATAAEMRGELSRLGLDSKGKRETLHRCVFAPPYLSSPPTASLSFLHSPALHFQGGAAEEEGNRWG